MTTHERRQFLFEMLRQQPGLRVLELAQALDVSEGTVRNDLNALEEEGKLKRVHGGAVLNEPDQFQSHSFDRRHKENVVAKLAIAQGAARLVNDGDSIFVDASSTSFFFARALAARRGLRVVTNGFEVAKELAKNHSNNVILLGGVVDTGSSSVTGLLSERIISEFHFQKTFLACSGFSLERGMTEVHLAEAQLKRKVIASTAKLFALVDSSKFGKEDLTPFARPEEIFHLFTDCDLSATWAEALQRAGINYTSCEKETAATPNE